MTKVLRFKKGSQLILGDGRGGEALGEIRKISPTSVLVSLQKKNHTKENASVSLYVALLKRENFEWVAQKATEIGVSEIIPLQTERVVKQGLKEDRIRKIIQEAVEQSGHRTIPELLPIMKFEDALQRSKDSSSRWFFDQLGKSFSNAKKSKKGSVSIFIGPEGGWTEKEKSMAKKSGLEIVSLENFTLRAETAAIIGVFMASSLKYKKGK